MKMNNILRLTHPLRALSLAVLLVASVAAAAAEAELAEGERPEVRIGSGALTATLPAGAASGSALRLVVVDPRDRILIDESTSSGSLSWTLPADAIDGYHRFEARIVPRPGDGGSATATDETPTPRTARRAGTFLLRDGRMIDLDAARDLAAERLSTEPEISSAGASDPAAEVESMADFTISDPNPTLFFEDTYPDDCEGVDWLVTASGAVPGVPNFNFMEVRARAANCGSFRLMDWEYDSSRSVNSQFNAFRVHGSSDISLGDGTFFFDKSGPELGIGTTTPAATIHMAHDFPQIRFDETNDSLAQFSIQADSVPNNQGSRELFFQDEADGDILMTLEQSGELGIGSEEPAAQLHVFDSAPGPGSHAIIAQE